MAQLNPRKASPLNLKLVASVLIAPAAEALAGGAAVGGGLGPFAGRGVLIGLGNDGLEGGCELPGGALPAARPRLAGQCGAPALALGEPGRRGWGAADGPVRPPRAWGGGSRTIWLSGPSGTERAICLRKSRTVRARGRREPLPIPAPGTTSSAAHRAGGGAGALGIVRAPLSHARPPRPDRRGAGEGREPAFLGATPPQRGVRRRQRAPAPRARTLSPPGGALESGKGSARGGCRPPAPQLRRGGGGDSPGSLASKRSD